MVQASTSEKSDCSWTWERQDRSVRAACLKVLQNKDIRDGNLGAARIANDIKFQYGDAYNGRKDRMTNWVQVAVEADSIANVPTIYLYVGTVTKKLSWQAKTYATRSVS